MLELDIESQPELAKTLERLQRANDRFNRFADNAVDVLSVMLLPSKRYSYINSASTSIYGHTPEEFQANPGLEQTLVHPDWQFRYREFMKGLVGGDSPRTLEYKIRTRSGEERWLSQRGSLATDDKGTAVAIEAIVSDITERKRAEEALVDSQERLRLHVDQTPMAMIEWSLDFEVVDWNPAAERIFGFTREDAIGRHAAGLLVPDVVRPHVDRVWQDLLENKGGTRSTNQNMTKDGRTILCEWYNTPLVDHADSVVGVISTVQDVTERARAEEAQALLQAAIEQSAEAVIITDDNGKIEYVNPALARLTGYDIEDVIGKSPSMFLSHGSDEERTEHMWQTLKNGDEWKGRLLSVKKDGTQFSHDTTVSPVRDANGEITNYVSVGRDVTNEVELENRLRQAQKMEAMGTLAGGIAHDFNNLLQAMLGYADLVKSDLPGDSPTMDFIDQVIGAGDRAVELVSQILAFSRQTDREHRPLRLQSIVKEALKLLRPSLPATIDIRQNIDPDCKPIFADATEVHQAMMNLCTNAYHAMRDGGGVLEVTVKEVAVGFEESEFPSNLEPGVYGELTVADTGVGMDESVRARAFDPYFTTKPVGEGTGMGLATVLGIAEKCGGTVTIESEVGRGSRFRMYWPVMAQPEQDEGAPDEDLTALSGTETVLLVDDEQLVLGQVKAGLERLGYQVEARTSSVEALRAFEAAPDRYDTVITDQTMPNMTGLELAREILKTAPEKPVILCSGFSELGDDSRAKTVGISGFVRKPMLTNDLAREIRRTLEQ